MRSNTDIAFIIFTFLILTYIGYVIVRNIPKLSSFALAIVLLATLLTGASLLHAEKAVIYNGVADAAAFLDPASVRKICGVKTTENQLCYKEVEYRGYPSKALRIEKLEDGQMTINLEGWRGGGQFVNFLIYLTITAGIFYVILLLIPKKESPRI